MIDEFYFKEMLVIEIVLSIIIIIITLLNKRKYNFMTLSDHCETCVMSENHSIQIVFENILNYRAHISDCDSTLI